MVTAIDTNVLLDILVPNDEFYEASATALQQAANEGSLIISDIVYAGLCIHFEAQRECDAFLEGTEIHVQSLGREAHFLASRVWRLYRQQGGKQTRILPDFLNWCPRAKARLAAPVARPRRLSPDLPVT